MKSYLASTFDNMVSTLSKAAGHCRTPVLILQSRMGFKYKVRPYTNEDGEFDPYTSADEATIKKVFSGNFQVDDSLKNFRAIAVTDDRHQTMVVDYIKKGVCDIYFIPMDSDFYYFKKSTIESASHLIGLFLENNTADLSSLLNKRTEGNNYVRGDFFNKSFEYWVTPLKSLKEISWIWYALPVGLIFIALGIINFDYGVSAVLFIIGLIHWLPGLILHYQYHKDNRKIQVTLSRGSNIIGVTTPTLSKTFNKEDIREILKVESSLNRFAWGEYGFTRLEFKTGEVLNLTSLMIDQLFIEQKFHGVRTLKSAALLPTLDKRTRL